jgi:3-keto-disaccharide hydrolase
MRLFFPVILGLLVGCGSSPESTDTDASKSDTSMATSDTTSTMSETASLNTLTDAEKSEGWQLLFDGQTKNGWHSYNKKGNLDDWKVENGTLVLNSTKKDEDIVTDEEYESYHLMIDWNISEGGNSGIIFNVKESPEYDRTFKTGPEMQVLDNERHADAKIPKHRAGDLYDLIACSSETVKPAGQWNTAEIIKNKDSLTFRLNGTTVVQTIMFDDNWKKMVANSKFKEWKTFGTFKKGLIALQDHGDKVMYRNIKLRKL